MHTSELMNKLVSNVQFELNGYITMFELCSYVVLLTNYIMNK